MLTFETIYQLNFFTAAVHAVSGLVVFVKAFDMTPITPYHKDEVIGPYLPSVCFKSRLSSGIPEYFFVKPEVMWQLKEYTATLVTLFFVLSSAFQVLQGSNKRLYRERVESNGTNFIRYVEYSFSASLMMVCIATTLVIFDMFTHILIFTCTFACMSCGLMSDCLRTHAQKLNVVLRKYPGIVELQDTIDRLNKLKWRMHYMGWVTLLKPYIFVLGVSYFRTVYRNWECLESLPAGTQSTPAWVHAVVISQFLLFLCFGLVQLVQFRSTSEKTTMMTPTEENQENKRVGLMTEFSFIILSLTAKSVLGWIVAGNLLFVKI